MGEENRSGGANFEGTENVEIDGDVVGGDQTKNILHGPTSGPTMLGMIALVAIVALVVIVAVVGQREQAPPEPTPTITISSPTTATLPSLSPTVAPTIVTPATLESIKPPTTSPTSACEPGFLVTIEIEPWVVRKNGQATLTVTVKNWEGNEITLNPEINIIPIRSVFGHIESNDQIGVFTYYAPNYVPEPDPIDKITFLVYDGQCPIEQTIPVSID